MIRLSLFVFCALAAIAQQPGSVRGFVTSITGEPIRKAEVMLRNVASGADGRAFTTESDASGVFSVPSVPPGNYIVSARRTGFLRPEDTTRRQTTPATRAIAVAAGQEVDGIIIKLTPHAVLSGKITDEDGDPIFGASVVLVQETFTRGRRIANGAASTQSNDLGDYRLPGLQPGRYTLVVTPPAAFGSTHIRTRAPGQDSAVSFVPLYFPGVTDAAAATPMVLEPGQEIRGIDIRMRKAPVVTVRGRVVDTGGNAVPNASILIMSADNAGVPSFGVNTASSAGDGSFQLTGIPAGSYVVVANTVARDSRTTAATPIQVGSRDVENVVVRIFPPAVVSGVIKAEGAADLSKARVVLDPMDTFALDMKSSANIAAGGAFQVADVTPGRYRVGAFAIPEGYYVKSVQWNGEDIADKGLSVISSVMGLEVTLAKGASTLRGSLVRGDGMKVAAGSVALVPPENRRLHWDLYRTVMVDQNGEYVVRNVPPGEYEIFGFAPESEPSMVQNPDYVKQIAAKGSTIKVGEGQAERVDVKVVE